ncbi:MAG: hypothetical protein CVU84_11705 [Firmicutes bacterium HGW-Firmicutes-1]|jgi:two-component system response regulator YesN|nr:MAG: hypothetical protein CVU84_11705 [Firmicutes bacterium HGW-Firmicutes-1]
MFKLLIVDDEFITRKGIIGQIDFKIFDIEAIEEADDGLRALEVAKVFKPDIVISDIKMPRMDGMTFAFELKKILPSCRIIFMSAYTDLDYYRSAIKLNAISYIEKPIDLDEMKAAVKNAVEDLMQYLKFKNMSSKMNQLVLDNRDVLKSQLSALLINNKVNLSELNEKAEALGYELYTTGSYISIIVTQYTKGHLDPYELDTSKNKANLILKNYFQPLNCYKVWHYKGNMIVINLIASKNDQIILSPNRLKGIFEGIYDALQEFCKPSIAIGKLVTKASDAYQSYLSAAITLERLFYKEGKLVAVYEQKHLSSSYKYKAELLGDFNKLLEKAEPTECVLFVKQLTKNIQVNTDSTKNMIKDIYFQLAQIVDHFMDVSNQDQQEHLTWDAIASMVSLKELEKYLLDKTRHYFDTLKEQSVMNSMALRVKQYVQLHYDDMTLSIDSIAQELGVSNPYLCAVFKKETNQTINKYITNYRVEKSKALLKDFTLRIEDVASQVGYGDSDYFSKVFKKNALCTPTEYRKKYVV